MEACLFRHHTESVVPYHEFVCCCAFRVTDCQLVVHEVTFEIATAECDLHVLLGNKFTEGFTSRLIWIVAADPGIGRTGVQKNFDFLWSAASYVEFSNVAIVLVVLKLHQYVVTGD